MAGKRQKQKDKCLRKAKRKKAKRGGGGATLWPFAFCISFRHLPFVFCLSTPPMIALAAFRRRRYVSGPSQGGFDPSRISVDLPAGPAGSHFQR